MSKKKKEVRGSSEFPVAIVWWLLLFAVAILMSWDIDAWLAIPAEGGR